MEPYLWLGTLEKLLGLHTLQYKEPLPSPSLGPMLFCEQLRSKLSITHSAQAARREAWHFAKPLARAVLRTLRPEREPDSQTARQQPKNLVTARRVASSLGPCRCAQLRPVRVPNCAFKTKQRRLAQAHGQRRGRLPSPSPSPTLSRAQKKIHEGCRTAVSK